MGLSQSSPEEQDSHGISSHFSTTELKNLERIANLQDLTQKSDEAKGNEGEGIKERIQLTFDESSSTKVIDYMKRKSIIKDDATIDKKLFMSLVVHLTKDSITELAQAIHNIVGDGSEVVLKSSMLKFISDFIKNLLKGLRSSAPCFLSDEESSDLLAEHLVKDFPDKMRESDFDVTLHRTPLLIDILQYKFRLLFFNYVSEASKEVQESMPSLLPELTTDNSAKAETFLLTISTAIFLNSHLALSAQHKWRLLYSSRLHGESFSKMTGCVLGKGPTLLVVRDRDGHIFGGFLSESFQYSSKFVGTNTSFLFTLKPAMKVYTSTGYNDHYGYLNIGQETMPNGLGMGGQLGHFGLWLDQEFGKGHSKAKPSCTTYGSPQLSMKEEFEIDAVTLWGVGEEPKIQEDDDYNESMTSVLDKHVEAKALLEIAGKARVSEGLRDLEPDADIPETKELQHAHDPMT